MQSIKLGLTGAEQELPTPSRAFLGERNTLFSQEGRSASGVLHVDYIANKEGYTIQYGVLSEQDKETIKSIYLLQLQNASFLSLIYTKQDGTPIQVDVKMSAPSFGPLVIKDTYYYDGTSIALEEV